MNPATLDLRNQFGERSNNVIVGGSSLLWCNFVVDRANGNGLGLRSLKGFGVANAWMNTSSTPAGGNPNPAQGNIIVQLSSPYANYINGNAGFVSPVSGSAVNVTSGLTQYALYVITSVGTTTPAAWLTLGLAANVVPAVGATFVAATASAGTGTGAVMLAAAAGSGVAKIELVGDPNQTCNVLPGALIYSQCLAPGVGALTMNSYTPAGTITNGTPDTFAGTPAVLTGSVAAGSLALTQPADGTVIGMTFNMAPLPSSQI